LESAAYSAIGEHLQKPHNAGSRPQVQFFNTLLQGVYSFGLTPLSKTISPSPRSVWHTRALLL